MRPGWSSGVDGSSAFADLLQPAPPPASVKPRRPVSATAAGAPVASPSPPAPKPPLDPYLAWASLTRWRGYRRLQGPLGTGGEVIDHVRVLVRAPAELSEGQLQALMGDSRWAVAPVYKGAVPGTEEVSRFFTATVPREQLPWLASREHGITWELALPVRDAETAARAVGIGMTGSTRAPEAFRPAGPPLFGGVDRLAEVPGGEKPQAALAIIDFGCPFLHPAFADKTEAMTRVVALWDQGSDGEPDPSASNPKRRKHREPWSAADRMGYGRVMYAPTLNAVVRMVRTNSAPPIDEAEAYRQLDYLIDYDDARRRIWKATHGSHVTDLAAGSFDPLRGRDLDPPAQHEDPASEAPIVFVQLPSLTGADCTGGSLGAQVLDALRFVLDTCTRDARIVVNLSYGSFAGPHDGSSMIEQAIDDLVETCAGRLVVVLGAGNSRQADCHVRRTVRKNRSVLLNIGIDEGDFTDTFVETWFGSGAKDLALQALRLRVRTSEGDWSAPIRLGQQVTLTAPLEERPVALLRFDEKVPNGAGPLALLCIAPTARPADDDGDLAPAGLWQVELFFAEPDPAPAAAAENKTKVQPLPDDLELPLDAWVERDDPGWLGHGVQPRFTDPLHGDEAHTLNSLATGKFTIAVGGFRASTAEPAAYSSTGERKGPKVVYAVCEESEQFPNLRAAAVLSTDSLRMNGTSVAAPVFARRAYNWLWRQQKDQSDLPLDAAALLRQVIVGVVVAEGQSTGHVRVGPDG